MKIDDQLRILRRISALSGNPGEYKLHHAGPKVNYVPVNDRAIGASYDSIEDAIHNEIRKLELHGIKTRNIGDVS